MYQMLASGQVVFSDACVGRTRVGHMELVAHFQVVPIGMILDVIKRKVNESRSSHILLENFPWSFDQVKYLERQFHVDRVFCLEPSASQARCC